MSLLLQVVERGERALWVSLPRGGDMPLDGVREQLTPEASGLTRQEILALSDIGDWLVADPWRYMDTGEDDEVMGVAWLAFEDPVDDAVVLIVHRYYARDDAPEDVLVVLGAAITDDPSEWQQVAWRQLRSGNDWLADRHDLDVDCRI